MTVVTFLSYIREAWDIETTPISLSLLKKYFKERLQKVAKAYIVESNENYPFLEVVINGEFIYIGLFYSFEPVLNNTKIEDLHETKRQVYDRIKEAGGRFFFIEFTGRTFNFKEL